ncbi:MAG: hypothetical protein LBN95_05435 [Prevotellaceae bacterium]|jgi:hypothetical protein|nr:hypothetical protein [Prevotellaceae bacterium]
MINTFLDDDVMVCEQVCPQVVNTKIPEGYMTSEAFWHEADKRIINICKNYGVL